MEKRRFFFNFYRQRRYIKMLKDVNYYLNLNYKIKTVQLDVNYYLSSIPELGEYATCAFGKTKEESLKNLQFVLKNNVKSWLEDDVEIPEP